MKLKEIVYATQYYRSPTPLKDEWDIDLKTMTEFGLNTIQIRINWRNNERKENVYDFSDIDELIKVAEKNNKKIIIKFLLECAPQYIFDKYKGTRIGPKGEQLRGGSHGAYYAGGWSPCFTNPKVLERAKLFVKKATERYYKHSSIIMWNAWNEPRNKPIEECYCPECRKAFGQYLKNKFKTIENLNKFYGVCEESFEKIALPSMAHGVWDIFEFKKFKSGIDIYNKLKAVYDSIRVYDKKRPIISHSGYPSAFQNHVGDCLDEITVKEAVDMWGSSTPCDTKMNTLFKRLEFHKLLDFMSAVDKDFFLYEIYPGLGMFRYSYDDQFDMLYKLYNGLFSGAKGFNFWQYRSERVGSEADCAGLARVDGTPRDVLKAVKRFSIDLKILEKDEIKECSKDLSDIAIIFDYDSNLLSEIEDAAGVDYCFANYWNINYYNHSHTGMYRAIKSNGYNVDYLLTKNIKDIYKYKFVYLPCYEIISKDVKEELIKFVSSGGTLLIDEGIGLRDQNTWMTLNDIDLKPMVNAKLLERRLIESSVNLDNKNIKVYGYKSLINVSKSKPLFKFSDGSSAIEEIKYEKGKVILSNFGFGYNLYNLENKDLINAVINLLVKENIRPLFEVKNYEIEIKYIENNKFRFILITNLSNKIQTLSLKEQYYTLDNKKIKFPLRIDPNDFIILKCKK